MFQSFGYLKYDPKNIETRYKDWWLILKCDDGLTAYYRYWIEKEYPYQVPSYRWLDKAEIENDLKISWMITQHGVRTIRSAWGSHVSVIRGEKPENPDFWQKYENRKIKFEFNPEYISTNGKHWWVKVFSPELESIRMELGLTPQPMFFHRQSKEQRVNPFHLTLGHSVEQ